MRILREFILALVNFGMSSLSNSRSDEEMFRINQPFAFQSELIRSRVESTPSFHVSGKIKNTLSSNCNSHVYLTATKRDKLKRKGKIIEYMIESFDCTLCCLQKHLKSRPRNQSKTWITNTSRREKGRVPHILQHPQSRRGNA